MKPNPSVIQPTPSRPLAALLCLATLPAIAQLPTPAALSAQIRRDGAKVVVLRLNTPPPLPSGHTTWDRLTDRIRLGRPAWIALAPQLAQGTDAAASEDLGISLAFALPRSPAAVLSVLDLSNGPVLGVSSVCGAPFLEDTLANLPAYLHSARAAVVAVTKPSLQPARTACLQRLDAATAQLARPR